MTFSTGRRRGPAVLLATLAATTLAVAACDDGNGEDDTPPTSASTTSGASTTAPVSADQCVSVEHGGQTFGFTVPAGFTVETPPSAAADIAATYKVNLLSQAALTGSGGSVPEVTVAVFGFDKDDAAGDDALGKAMLRFTDLTGGSNRTQVTATPTTIAGVPGTAGGGTDNRALDYSDPDDVPTPIHWWTVGSAADGSEFVVAMAAKTPALDAEYKSKVESGLKPGGC